MSDDNFGTSPPDFYVFGPVIRSMVSVLSLVLVPRARCGVWFIRNAKFIRGHFIPPDLVYFPSFICVSSASLLHTFLDRQMRGLARPLESSVCFRRTMCWPPGRNTRLPSRPRRSSDAEGPQGFASALRPRSSFFLLSSRYRLRYWSLSLVVLGFCADLTLFYYFLCRVSPRLLCDSWRTVPRVRVRLRPLVWTTSGTPRRLRVLLTKNSKKKSKSKPKTVQWRFARGEARSWSWSRSRGRERRGATLRERKEEHRGRPRRRRLFHVHARYVDLFPLFLFFSTARLSAPFACASENSRSGAAVSGSSALG
jgi:hypothetical protein